MRKKYILFFILAIISLNKFNAQVIIISNFGDIKENELTTAVAFFSNNEITALQDIELIFLNSSNKTSLYYGLNKFSIFESKDNKYRYSYFNVIAEKKDSYYKGEKIGNIVNLKEPIILTIEDIKENCFINPLKVLNIIDTKKPIIKDVYVIDSNSEIKSLFSFKNYAIKKDSKLFINCYDFIDGSPNPLPPYKISYYISGELKKTIEFDKIKKDEIFSKKDEIYKSNERLNFYLGSLNILPGVNGLKIIIEDYNKNREEFKRPIKIEL